MRARICPAFTVSLSSDEHSGDIAGDFRGDGGAVGLYIGVVRRHLEATHRPILPAEIGRARQGGDSHAGEEQRTQPTLASRLWCVGKHCGRLRNVGGGSCGISMPGAASAAGSDFSIVKTV